MRRGEVWWADLRSLGGTRPVLLLSRNAAYQVRALITVAPVTQTIRHIPPEVSLGTADGMPRDWVANLDDIMTIPKSRLQERITVLSSQHMRKVAGAINFALDLST